MKYLCYIVYFSCLCVVSVRCQAVSCTTPNGEKAFYKSILTCPVLRTAMAERDPYIDKFIEASALTCGPGPLLVCCGSYGKYANLNNTRVSTKSSRTLPTTPEAKRAYAVKNLIPSKKFCGMQHADDYFRDYNTSETTVDELPWIMFLSCSDDGTLSSSWSSDRPYGITSRTCDCSGILISNRYVLTSWNCNSAKWVGLGQREQYKNISCTPTPYGDDCSEAVAQIPIAEKIMHPDISLLLLRLDIKVDYSDYIRPICLPLEDADSLDAEDTIISSKWEIDDKVRGFARYKINHTITDNERCSDKFLNYNSAEYMCTQLENNETVICKTDSGSGMMYKRNNNWFVGGILQGGLCTNELVGSSRLTPLVIDWILVNLKP